MSVNHGMVRTLRLAETDADLVHTAVTDVEFNLVNNNLFNEKSVDYWEAILSNFQVPVDAGVVPIKIHLEGWETPFQYQSSTRGGGNWIATLNNDVPAAELVSNTATNGDQSNFTVQRPTHPNLRISFRNLDGTLSTAVNANWVLEFEIRPVYIFTEKKHPMIRDNTLLGTYR
mgnify:CR=1 FL=1